jgi:hypothetical protein
MQLSLRPRVEVAFSLFSDVLLVGAGTFLDLPFTNVSIKQLSTTNTDSNCEGSDGIPVGEADFAKVFTNLTHVVPMVGLGVGIDVGLVLNVPTFSKKDFGDSKELMSTASSLPTACLVFQKTGIAVPGFAPATAVLAQLKAQETAKGGTGGGGGITGGEGGQGTPKKSDARSVEYSGFWKVCVIALWSLLL